MKNVTILDSAGQAFFARQLEYILPRTYDVVYKDLRARELLPVSYETPEAADTITYRTYDMVGSARIINAYADDLPRADVYGKETISPVRGIGVSFGYNRDEILKAQFTGMALDQRRANAASRAFEEVVDEVAWNGDATSGLTGVFTHPNIPSVASTTTGWLGATPDEIIADINNAMGIVRETTKMKEQPDTLLVPVRAYNHIAGTPRATMSDTTILQYVLQNVPGLAAIEGVNELTTDAFLYTRSADKLEMHIPKELEFLPPQEVGLELKVPAWGKTAGVLVYYPLSAIHITDILV